ncbi:MAG: flagellar biosynthetic protein FliO [Xanthobacteraceae bacterium]
MLGDMPLPAKFVIAFILVFALIAGVAWLVRRFGSGALSSSSGRGRQARLGVIEATAVDNRRRLVLVRRDNVEHLIMLGGPTDVVVEANIVRAHAAAGREASPPRAPEPAGWQTPAEDGWPAAPEPVYRPMRGAERAAPPAVADDLPLQPYTEPAPREPAPRAPSGERLAGLAAEIARAGGGRVEPPVRRPVEPRRAAPPPPPRHVEEPHAGDEHLASMAQQLEAALRRPGQPAAARDSAGEPRVAGLTARRPGEPREQRHSLIERAKQARSAASLATPRARDAKPEVREPEPQVAPEPAQNEGADLAMVYEPLPPPPATEPAPEPAVAEASAPDETAGPVERPQGPEEHAEPPAETKSPSLEEEMANLLGRAPGRT